MGEGAMGKRGECCILQSLGRKFNVIKFFWYVWLWIQMCVLAYIGM